MVIIKRERRQCGKHRNEERSITIAKLEKRQGRSMRAQLPRFASSPRC